EPEPVDDDRAALGDRAERSRRGVERRVGRPRKVLGENMAADAPAERGEPAKNTRVVDVAAGWRVGIAWNDEVDRRQALLSAAAGKLGIVGRPCDVRFAQRDAYRLHRARGLAERARVDLLGDAVEDVFREELGRR